MLIVTDRDYFSAGNQTINIFEKSIADKLSHPKNSQQLMFMEEH
jgi:hypothetical protein